MASYIQFQQPNPTTTVQSIKDFATTVTAFYAASADAEIFEELVRAALPDAVLSSRANSRALRAAEKAMYQDFETPVGSSTTTYQDIFDTETGSRVVLVKKTWFDANIKPVIAP